MYKFTAGMITAYFLMKLRNYLISILESGQVRSALADYLVVKISKLIYEEPQTLKKSQVTRRTGQEDPTSIVVGTRNEALEVITQLNLLIAQYGSASVGDLYDLVGSEKFYTDEQRGWTDLRGCDAIRVPDGYKLNIPRPEPISELETNPKFSR